MSDTSFSVSDRHWRWHQAFAIAISFLWPRLGRSYLGLLDHETSSWSSTCNTLYIVAFLLWLVVTQSAMVHIFVGFGILWILLTAVIAVCSIPAILASRKDAARIYQPGKIIIPAIWIALAAVALSSSPWSKLTILSAPSNSSPLLPAGTWYFALGFDRSDQFLNRGQLITYRAAKETQIARIIGVPGDIVRVEQGGFFVNGAFASSDIVAKAYATWALRDLVQFLRHPDKVSLDKIGSTLAPDPNLVTYVGHVLVVTDQELMRMGQHELRPQLVGLDDVVAVPVAEVWALDGPGSQSNLAQWPPEFE